MEWIKLVIRSTDDMCLDLRDLFAMQAMSSLLAARVQGLTEIGRGIYSKVATEAYVVADKMLEARSKK